MNFKGVLVILVMCFTTTMSPVANVELSQLFIDAFKLSTLVNHGPPETKEETEKLVGTGVKLVVDSVKYGIAAVHSTAKEKGELYLQHYVKFLENRNQELTVNLVKLEATNKENKCPAPAPILMPARNRESISAAINPNDADKTGRPDLAQESRGGSVVRTKTVSESPIYFPAANIPQNIIQPGMMPGDCWSFDGAEGFIVLKLIGPSRVTGFTLEHLPKSISPFGHIDSAPKRFQVVGLTDCKDLATEFVFGEYQYDDNNIPIQYFDVKNSSDTFFPYVELKILSNHGNLAYTCLYRFRVHGYLESWLTIIRI